MKETDVQIFCGCDAATVCPQGHVGADRQCVINIPEDDLFRIVMGLPEYQRRHELFCRFNEMVTKIMGVLRMNEQKIEEEIQAKGLNAPRLKPEDLDAVIRDEAYHVFPGTTMTVCCLTLHNGFNVVGESAAASPENFDAEIGRKIAYGHARDQIWGLEGYLLKERLHKGTHYAAGEGS